MNWHNSKKLICTFVDLSRLSVLKVQAYIIQEANDLPESRTILSAKCLTFALNGITSLSVKPLRLVMSLGIIVSILSFIGVIWAVVDNLLGNTVTGWASTVCIVCFMGNTAYVPRGYRGIHREDIYGGQE